MKSCPYRAELLASLLRFVDSTWYPRSAVGPRFRNA